MVKILYRKMHMDGAGFELARDMHFTLPTMLIGSDSTSTHSVMSLFHSPVDQVIIMRAAHRYGDMDERRDIFESHRHHIFSVAYYMTGDEREAETILQSTFIEAFSKQPKPSIDALDKSLMHELHGRLSLQPVPPLSAQESGLNGRNVRRTDLEEALWSLPARERLCFLLRDVEGYIPGRIAKLLKSSEVEIRRTVLSARIRIRSLLNQRNRTADHGTEQEVPATA